MALSALGRSRVMTPTPLGYTFPLTNSSTPLAVEKFGSRLQEIETLPCDDLDAKASLQMEKRRERGAAAMTADVAGLFGNKLSGNLDEDLMASLDTEKHSIIML